MAPFLVLLLSPAAWAWTPAGYGVPAIGGLLAGPTADGAPGLCTNPAAAAPIGTSVLFDLALLGSSLSYTLDAAPDQALGSDGLSPVPTLSLAVPFGRLGTGVALFVPAARGGGEPAGPLDPQRLYGMEGGLRVIEADPALALRLNDSWTIGAGARLGYGTLSSLKALDTGAMINRAVGDEVVPVADPFLEGRMALDGHSGVGAGGTLGVRWAGPGGQVVGIGLRTPLWLRMDGPVSLTPSTSLSLVVEAQASTALTLPAAVFLGAELPVGRATLLPELSVIGWSSLATIETAVSEIRVTSPDAVMEGIIASYGVNEADLFDSLSSSSAPTGMRDVVNAGLTAAFPAGEQAELRLGAAYLPAAVPEGYVHPSNLDFSSVDLRAGLRRPLAGAWEMLLSFDAYLSPARVVDDSLHALSGSRSGALIPSADGTYSLVLLRAGLSLHRDPTLDG
jgi:Outer membrane protein transport protein (OMPP1/FadL/TodX)